ncbi:TetR/AcrR family transcriptional regulator [Streptomyces sp. NPDC090741]|uniref:TetR/AcrR family transcriptional regulator n=1 Tax=Streptomyces sp. NPDC090741 TaxID=3365967 RepID=UPI0037F7C9CA
MAGIGTASGPRAAAIFDAARELLAERGHDGLTIEAVARAAGVNKTTIYRWWPSKPALVRATVLHARALDISVPDTGSLRGDLVALVEQVTGLLTGPHAEPVVRALAGASGQPELAELTRELFAGGFAREQPVFERARARGELPATDPQLLVDLVAGAVRVRVLLRRQPLPDRFAADVVDAVLHSARYPGEGE